MHPTPDRPGPGQESVWAFPRPAIAEPTPRRIRIIHRGHVLADTTAAVRTLETSHPPSYYIPRQDVAMAHLHPTSRRSLCEWKGQAGYFTVTVDGQAFENAAWSYRDPTPEFALIRDHIAFYPAPFDSCLVDDLPVIAQPGGFYGGWITPDLAGPFKGIPGSNFW